MLHVGLMQEYCCMWVYLHMYKIPCDATFTSHAYYTELLSRLTRRGMLMVQIVSFSRSLAPEVALSQ